MKERVTPLGSESLRAKPNPILVIIATILVAVGLVVLLFRGPTALGALSLFIGAVTTLIATLTPGDHRSKT